MERQNTPALSPEHRHWIGMRIIKTVVAVFFCGLLAYFREASGFYSMIAAVVCIQNSAGKTIESSVNRMIGTLIGGVAGVLVVYSLDTLGVLYIELLRYAVLSVMLIPIIKLCLIVKKPGCAAMACIVFLCVTVNHSMGDTPAIYSIDRLFETLVGVALACGIDILLPYQPMPQPAQEAPPAPEEDGTEADRAEGAEEPARDSGEEPR
ncbi:MAG: hypothetical protein HFF26_02590 [Oscillospiraceae bacterium]|nr:hypothetical protein [Oscillospiraceae bacterium]